MSDLISKQKAIDAIREFQGQVTCDFPKVWEDGMNKGFDHAVRVIELMDTVEAQQWIPFSERKPDTGGHVIITVLWEKGVDTAFDDDYEVMEEDWGVGEAEIAKGTATPLVKRIHERAIAWMPMPKEYRGEK